MRISDWSSDVCSSDLHMARVFPQLRDIGIDHAWGGTLSVTPTRLPYVRSLAPGLYSASGFSGLGVVLAPYFGRILGDAIAGDGRPNARLSHLPVPALHRGRRLTVPHPALGVLALTSRGAPRGLSTAGMGRPPHNVNV